MIETLARTSYNAGNSDRATGKAIGRSPTWVRQWRLKNNLPANKHRERVNPKSGIDYRKVLTPAQCEEMHSFLTTLKACYRMTKAEGVKPRIDEFMREWAGIRADEK